MYSNYTVRVRPCPLRPRPSPRKALPEENRLGRIQYRQISDRLPERTEVQQRRDEAAVGTSRTRWDPLRPVGTGIEHHNKTWSTSTEPRA